MNKDYEFEYFDKNNCDYCDLSKFMSIAKSSKHITSQGRVLMFHRTSVQNRFASIPNKLFFIKG